MFSIGETKPLSYICFIKQNLKVMKKTNRYNKSEIMKEAHRLYKCNKPMGWSWSLSVAWSNTKTRILNEEVEAKNEAIRAMWKAQAEAKRKAELEAEERRFKDSGMDLHTYTMTNYYNGYGYKGD